jgi:hypothetical protein
LYVRAAVLGSFTASLYKEKKEKSQMKEVKQAGINTRNKKKLRRKNIRIPLFRCQCLNGKKSLLN